MTPESIVAFAAAGESETLEFKTTTGDEDRMRHAQPPRWTCAVRGRARRPDRGSAVELRNPTDRTVHVSGN